MVIHSHTANWLLFQDIPGHAGPQEGLWDETDFFLLFPVTGWWVKGTLEALPQEVMSKDIFWIWKPKAANNFTAHLFFCCIIILFMYNK